MKTFLDAYKIGVSSVTLKETERDEITRIIRSLSYEIWLATDYKVLVKEDTKGGIDDLNHCVLNAIGDGKKSKPYSNTKKELAKFKRGDLGGFPCTLRYCDINKIAYDAGSLEQILTTMLMNCKVAYTIIKLA